MKVLTALIGSAEDGRMFMADVLQIEGSYWLVPMWSEAIGLGWKSPKRIIRLPEGWVQQTPDQLYDLLIKWPIPSSVLSGQSQSAQGVVYEVQEAPAIQIPTQRLAH
jgi:hypothetical protein